MSSRSSFLSNKISCSAWLIFFCFFLCLPIAKGQNQYIYIGVQPPLSYSLGLQSELSESIALDIRGGLLAWPWDKAILELLKVMGTEEPLVNTIGEAFSVGYTFQPGLVLKAGRWYFGMNYLWTRLIAKEVPSKAIENYYGIGLPGILRSERNYTLCSDLHNAGVIAGRRFPLRLAGWEIRTEFSIAKTFASSASLSSPRDYDLVMASSLIDEELNAYYLDYGYLPSLGVYVCYSW